MGYDDKNQFYGMIIGSKENGTNWWNDSGAVWF